MAVSSEHLNSSRHPNPPAASRRSGAAWRRLLAVALFLTFDLIMFGAFVRVTDAGLGCPDWPGCYGKATPLGALENIRTEAAERPDGPVTVFKAWVEMLHRYIAAVLGLIVIALVILARRTVSRAGVSRAKPVPATARAPLPSVALAWFTLAWILMQGAFGALTVTMKLQPAIVTLHLLGGMGLFALLVAQWARTDAPVPALPGEAARARQLAPLALGALALLWVQIALGGWVSTNYATLACRDFPMCQGQWWPPADFARGFELWRALGMSGDGRALPFQALTAIHLTHRCFAFVVFAVLGLLAWRLQGVAVLRRYGHALAAVLVLQAVTGLTNIFLDWPLAAAVAHTGGAAALVGLLVVVAFVCRSARVSMDVSAQWPPSSHDDPGVANARSRA